MEKKENQLFRPGNLHGNVHVGYYRTRSTAEVQYANQFKKAATYLTKKLQSTRDYHDLEGV